MRYLTIATALMMLMSASSAWAKTIYRTSFENETLAGNVTTEAMAEDPALQKEMAGRWRAVAWGVPEATTDASSIVADPSAPDGKQVVEVHHQINQISAVVMQLDTKQLVPGRWYRADGKIRTEGLRGQGCHLNLEYWIGGNGSGSVDSEHLVGDNGWTDASAVFQAPNSQYNLNLSFFVLGGPGKAWLDDVRVRQIEKPAFDQSKRRVLDGSFWGMFTCFPMYLHQYGKDMKEAGVYWQRQGSAALNEHQQGLAQQLGMAFEMCLDGTPPASDREGDEQNLEAGWPGYEKWVAQCLEQAGPAIRIIEVANEPNTHVQWTLPGYAELLCRVGKMVKEHKSQIAFATGGFTSPQIGYTEACLKRGADKVLDIVLIHPYAVDEALDSQLFALGDACARAGRPDLAVAINETGFPTWDPATGHPVNAWFVTEKDQAAKVVKLHVQALAHQCSFVTYLGWNDFAEPKSDQAMNMGLVRVDGSPKPSWHAYRFMTATVADRRQVEWSYADNGARVYRLAGEKPLWICWNALRESDVTIDTGDVQVFPCDIYGVKQTVEPVAGKVTVKAADEPIYLVPVP